MPIQKRYSNWYSRVAVPRDLRDILVRDELVTSLRTTSQREAHTRSHAAEAPHYRLFEMLRVNRDRMSTDQLRTLAQRYLKSRLETAAEDAATNIAAAPTNPLGLEVRADDLTEELQGYERRFASKGLQRELGTLADALINEAGIQVEPDSDAYKLFLLWLLKAKQEAASAELGLLNGDLTALPPLTSPSAGEPKGEGRPVPLTDAASRYLAFKRTQGAWTAQTEEMHEATYAELVSLVGDKPVAQLAKADLLRYYSDLPKLPSNAAKKWPGKTPREVIDETAGKDVPRLSPRSVNKRLVMVRSLFGWMELADLIERDPSEVLKAVPEDDAREARLPLTDSEVLALLALCETDAEQPAHSFVPRILAYSGLRLDEAAQLTRSDIVKAGDVWCFNVNADEGRKVKTATAKRLVPIHGVIREDVLRYREGRTEGNLWGLVAGARGGHSAALGRWLGRRVRKITTDRRKVIHSLRHSVATKLKATGVQEYEIEALLGHASRSMSTGRYGKAIDPRRLAAIVGMVGY